MPTKVADAIPLYLEALVGRGLKPGTVGRHQTALVGANRYKGVTSFLDAAVALKGPNVTMGQLDHTVFARYMASTNGGQGNRNNRLEAGRQFLAWAERAKMLRPGLNAEDILDGYK